MGKQTRSIFIKRKAKKCGLKEGILLRNLIDNFEPKEKPSEEFYETMQQMRSIGNNLNQIARKANSTGDINYQLYQHEAKKWNQFMIEVKRKYLLPKKS